VQSELQNTSGIIRDNSRKQGIVTRHNKALSLDTVSNPQSGCQHSELLGFAETIENLTPTVCAATLPFPRVTLDVLHGAPDEPLRIARCQHVQVADNLP
jgi:hypothetical protein